MAQPVYLVVAWLSGLVVLIMMAILWITHVETKNSKRQIASQIILHYNHRFHRMKMTFDTYNIFNEYKDKESALTYFSSKQSFLEKGIGAISNEISQNCVNNEFVFVKKAILRNQMTFECHQMIEDFHDFMDLYKEAVATSSQNNPSEFNDQWEKLTQTYNMIILRIIDVQKYLSNDVYLEIL